MDIKLSISILISSAYFLTLLIFKILTTGDLMRSLSGAGIHSVIVFVIIYILILYIDFSFEGLKKQKTKSTIEHLKRLEDKYREREKTELDKKFKELQEKELKKETEQMENIDTTKVTIKNITDLDSKEQNAEDIEKLKQDSGTQFDPNYIQKYDIPQI